VSASLRTRALVANSRAGSTKLRRSGALWVLIERRAAGSRARGESSCKTEACS
jgi:hypothetical protein